MSNGIHGGTHPPHLQEMKARIAAYDPLVGMVDLRLFPKCQLTLEDCVWAVEQLQLLPGLTAIDISANRIGEQGAILISRHLRKLSSLNISGNPFDESTAIGAAGAVAIAGNLKDLNSLDISANLIGETGAIAVAQNLKALTSLNVRNNFVGDNGAIAIARNLEALRSLNVSCTRIGKAGVVAISQNLKALTALDISANVIGDAGSVIIARNFKHLMTLDIGDNGIGEAGAIAIAQCLTALVVLKIERNAIAEAGAVAIANYLRQLTALDISDNNIKESGALAIAQSLTTLTSLKMVGSPFVRTNAVSDAVVIAIAKHLKALNSLDISINNICHAKTIVDLIETLSPVLEAVAPLGGKLTKISIIDNPLRYVDGSDVDQSTLQITDPVALRNALVEGQRRGIRMRFGRCVQAGPGEVGKSTAYRFATGHAERATPIDRERFGPTIGFESTPIEQKVVDKGKNENVKLAASLRVTMIDTGGQLPQLRSHCNLIYRNTRRTIFSLVLRWDWSWAKNRADWYLRMLDYWHEHNRRDTAKMPVILVTTYGEVLGAARALELPPIKTLQERFPTLQIVPLDETIHERDAKHIHKKADGKLAERIDGQLRQRIIQCAKELPGAQTTLIQKQLDVEAALRAYFELDAEDQSTMPTVPMMKVDEFKEWLGKQGVDEPSMPMHLHYLADAMALMTTDLDRADEKAIEGDEEDERRINRGERRAWNKVIPAVFNPRFILNLIYDLTMDLEIAAAGGLCKMKRWESKTRRLTGEQQPLLMKLLEDHLMVFEYERTAEHRKELTGYLIPDQLPERDEKYRERWTDAQAVANITFRCWLGEHRLFGLLADERLGQENIKWLDDISDDEKRDAKASGVDNLMGIWRNEACVRDGDAEALIQTDVFTGKIKVSARAPEAADARVLAGSVMKKLVGDAERLRMAEVEWEPRKDTHEIRPAVAVVSDWNLNEAKRSTSGAGEGMAVPSSRRVQLYEWRQVARLRWSVTFNGSAGTEFSVGAKQKGMRIYARILSHAQQSDQPISYADLYRLEVAGESGSAATTEATANDAGLDLSRPSRRKREGAEAIAAIASLSRMADDTNLTSEERERAAEALRLVEESRARSKELNRFRTALQKSMTSALSQLRDNGLEEVAEYLESNLTAADGCYYFDLRGFEWDVSILDNAARP